MSGRSVIVEEQQMAAALDWLRDNAAAVGEARREMIRTEKMTKHILALEKKRHIGQSVAVQEREALASDRYLEAIEAEAAAAGKLEEMRALREAAVMKIEVWRSEQANYRGMRV